MKTIALDPDDQEAYELLVAAVLADLIDPALKLRTLFLVFTERAGKSLNRQFISTILGFGDDGRGDLVWFVVNPEWEYLRFESLAGVYTYLAKTRDFISYDHYITGPKAWKQVGYNGLMILNQFKTAADVREAGI